jgi:hypothetical protein
VARQWLDSVSSIVHHLLNNTVNVSFFFSLVIISTQWCYHVFCLLISDVDGWMPKPGEAMLMRQEDIKWIERLDSVYFGFSVTDNVFRSA